MENLTWYIMETKKCKKKEWKTRKQKRNRCESRKKRIQEKEGINKERQ